MGSTLVSAAGEIDPKVLSRLGKLLALAKDGAATEGEADNAMRMAQALLEANNLTMAELEASGRGAGEGGARAKSSLAGCALYDYQQELMAAIAAVSFCHATVTAEWRRGRRMPLGYRLVGREANVAGATALFEYLNSTINRLARERYQVKDLLSRRAISYKLGLSRRLQERLLKRHEDGLREQERAAKEERRRQDGRTRPPRPVPRWWSSCGTSPRRRRT